MGSNAAGISMQGQTGQPAINQIHNIQNISNYHFELPPQIVLGENEVRSLDRIVGSQGMDSNGENSLVIPKRPYNNPQNATQSNEMSTGGLKNA